MNQPRQITDGPSISHPSYFLQSSFYPGGREMFFTSYRSGNAQVWKASLETGEQTETPVEIAARIERAEHILGHGRVGWVHPDCGFWMLRRSIADRKIEALVKGRDLYLGRR